MSDLPEGWEWATLEELVDPSRPICYGILMPKAHVDDGVPVVKVKDFSRGPIDPMKLGRTAPEIAAKYERSGLRGGEVLVSIRGTYGRVATVPDILSGANITQDSARLACVTSISRDLLLRYIESPEAQRYFTRVARGVAVKGVNIRDLKVLHVPVPPRAEQERIVAAIEEHLSRLDAAEAQLHAVLARSVRLDEVAVATALTKRQSEWTTLGEIADIKGGVTKDAKRQGDPSFVEVPYLRVANVQRGYLDLAEVTNIRVDPKKAEQLRLRDEDILFNEGGDRDKLGRGWVWEGQVDPCIHQNHVFRARLLDGRFNPYFVSLHANSWGRRWFEEHGRQTTNLASINLGTLRQFPVPTPSRAEQDVAVAEVMRIKETTERLRATLQAAQRRTAALRRSILAAAFDGKLVAQDPEDEPASVLLERIRAERAAALSTKRKRKVSS